MFEHLVNSPESVGRPGELARSDFPLQGPEGEIVEVPLLLPVWQVSALERVAHQRGLTAGQMVRQLLCDVLRPVGSARGEGPSCPFLAT
jgi:hypothetical protein